ncbi:nitroreductase family protein [Solibacillus silvestris]
MSLLLTDPMVQFPKQPQIMPTIKFIVDDAVTVYGSVDGPFRMNGTAVKAIVTTLLPYLSQGLSLDQLYLISEFTKEEVNQLLEILYVKGCLIDKSEIETNLDYFYARNITKYKNYRGISDFKEYISRGNIYIVGDDPEYIKSLEEKISDYNIKVQTFEEVDLTTNFDAELALCIYVSANYNSNVINHFLGNMDVLYVNPQTIQVGPLFSKKGVIPVDYDTVLPYVGFNENASLIHKDELINLVTLNAIRTMGKLANSGLNEGLYKKGENRFEYFSIKAKLHEHTDLNVKNFEKFVQFPASKFINASSHLEHYKAKNLKLSAHNQVSFLWRKISNTEVPSNIDLLIKNTVGFKNQLVKYKRFAPSGGNINANLLFYVNKNEKLFNGKGIYFYNNVDDTYYQVLDDSFEQVTNFEMLLGNEHSANSKGYLLIGSDVDIIAEKYSEFSFKIANLNSGVCLSNILTLAHIEETKMNVITSFNEEKILELIGVERSNETINFVLEVL